MITAEFLTNCLHNTSVGYNIILCISILIFTPIHTCIEIGNRRKMGWVWVQV